MLRLKSFAVLTLTTLAACASPSGSSLDGPLGDGDAVDPDPTAPDARPGTPDARPGTPDAAHAAPDAANGTPDAMAACAVVGTTLNIDIPAVTLSGAFTLNGSAPLTTNQYGQLDLRNAAGDDVFLGNTSDGHYSQLVIPGTYDVYYAHASGTQSVPGNRAAKLLSNVVINSSRTLDIDTPAVTLSGAFTLNGAAPPTTNQYGQLFLRNAAGDEVFLGNTSDGHYSQLVVPGSYDVYYARASGQTTVPGNTDAKLMSNVTINASKTLDINVPAVTLSGTFTLNGAAPPATNQYGQLLLRNAAGDEVFLGNTSDGHYSQLIVPGTYDVYYDRASGQTTIPGNYRAKLMSSIAVNASKTLDINVPAVTLSGAFTLNGAAPPTTNQYGQILLKNAAGDTVSLGNTSDGHYSQLVVPGTYDVYYDRASGQTTIPGNVDAKLMSSVAVNASKTLDINVPAVTLSGAFTLNGAPPPTINQYGQLLLKNAAGDTVALGNTSDGHYRQLLVPGTYDVYYSRASGQQTIPGDSNAKLLSNVAVTASKTLDLNIPAVTLMGTFTLNGAPPPTGNEYGQLLLSSAGGDAVPLGSTSDGHYSQLLVPGTFDIIYTRDSGTTGVPGNVRAVLRCAKIGP